MRILIRSIATSALLSGSVMGRRMLADLISAAPQAEEPIPVYLDFQGIELATSSFLRESVLAFRDACSQSLPNLYPVVANASESVLEELQFFVRERSDAIWCCELSADGVVSNARVLGRSKLEDGQRVTLDHIAQLKEASAPALYKLDSSIQPTGWNNRLSGLASKRLLIERREGKLKIFSSVLEVC